MPWSAGILECLASPNLSPTCLVAHGCCRPCVWTSALQRIEAENASRLGVLLCVGGDAFAGYLGRRAVVRHYALEERDLETAAVACLLGPCGRVQEVDTIVEREGLTYGILGVHPASVRNSSSLAPSSAPVQATMLRPMSVSSSTRV